MPDARAGRGPHQPPALRAILGDARAISANRRRPLIGASDRQVARAALRLLVESDAFAAQALYRLRARLRARRVPVLPWLLHRLEMALSGICIGNPVSIKPGLHLLHGQIVIDGMVTIEQGASIAPFVTIGLRSGELAGPRIGRHVTIGSGARVLGDIEVGERAKIAANAVVLDDVPAGATVAGVPARVVRDAGTDER